VTALDWAMPVIREEMSGPEDCMEKETAMHRHKYLCDAAVFFALTL